MTDVDEPPRPDRRLHLAVLALTATGALVVIAFLNALVVQGAPLPPGTLVVGDPAPLADRAVPLRVLVLDPERQAEVDLPCALIVDGARVDVRARHAVLPAAGPGARVVEASLGPSSTTITLATGGAAAAPAVRWSRWSAGLTDATKGPPLYLTRPRASTFVPTAALLVEDGGALREIELAPQPGGMADPHRRGLPLDRSDVAVDLAPVVGSGRVVADVRGRLGVPVYVDALADGHVLALAVVEGLGPEAAVPVNIDVPAALTGALLVVTASRSPYPTASGTAALALIDDDEGRGRDALVARARALAPDDPLVAALTAAPPGATALRALLARLVVTPNRAGVVSTSLKGQVEAGRAARTEATRTARRPFRVAAVVFGLAVTTLAVALVVRRACSFAAVRDEDAVPHAGGRLPVVIPLLALIGLLALVAALDVILGL